MVFSKARTVAAYLSDLPADRREAIGAVRDVIIRNLPTGYQELMAFGMVAYVVPLARYPKTYNDQPLMYAALAAQKNHTALYLLNIYSDQATSTWFEGEYAKSGKRMDLGKSCVRFRKLDDLPFGLIGEAVARTSVGAFIESYEDSRNGRS